MSPFVNENLDGFTEVIDNLDKPLVKLFQFRFSKLKFLLEWKEADMLLIQCVIFNPWKIPWN